jgi:hypothetical protein
MGKTYTAEELIKILGEYPSAMKVITTWEGIYAPINKIELNKCNALDGEIVILLDVNRDENNG